MTLKTLARRVIDTQRLLRAQDSLIASYEKLVAVQQDEVRHLRLEHAREIQGILCGWLINIETPEVDVRDDLARLESDLAHQIARLEEHIVR